MINEKKCVPDLNQCHEIISNMQMPDHILAHSVKVCKVALIIGDELERTDNNIDINLLAAGALLHDITKARSLVTGEKHSETGAELLKAKGYKKVADIVRQHGKLDNFLETGPVTEAEIVNYADKRVLGDKIAPLYDRMAYIVERYGTTPQKKEFFISMWKQAERLEKKLFRNIFFSPEELEKQLRDFPIKWLHTHKFNPHNFFVGGKTE